jgi:very-short-patch-repair endonuclease
MRIDPTWKERARRLRRESTPAEKILWPQLRGRRFAGFKFRRQHVLGPFIVDFYCSEAALVVELDGETHLGREASDLDRKAWLERAGLLVLRFWNNAVYDDRDAVLEAIWQACDARRKSRPLTPDRSPPKRARGEGDC